MTTFGLISPPADSIYHIALSADDSWYDNYTIIEYISGGVNVL